MGNSWFKFKQFSIEQKQSAFRFGTDSALLGAWVDISEANTILDVGSGTGALSLMCAQRTQQAQIFSIELDRDSFEESVRNYISSPWSDRLSAIYGDFRTYSFDRQFNHIISNPPFFAASTKNDQGRVTNARHEVMLTLSQFLSRCKELLAEKGFVSFVLPFDRKSEIHLEAKKQNLYLTQELRIQPKAEKEPNRILVTYCNQQTSSKVHNLILYEDDSQYSKDALELLKPFYLNL